MNHEVKIVHCVCYVVYLCKVISVLARRHLALYYNVTNKHLALYLIIHVCMLFVEVCMI